MTDCKHKNHTITPEQIADQIADGDFTVVVSIIRELVAAKREITRLEAEIELITRGVPV